MRRLAASIAMGLLLASGQVQAQSAIVLIGGPVTLQIASAVAGSDPLPVMSATTTLAWNFNGKSKEKIVVSTNAPGQRFTLKVVAINVIGVGVPQPEVTLSTGMLAADFIREVQLRTPSSATIRYTASATAAQGNTGIGAGDLHTVTYTITSQ